MVPVPELVPAPEVVTVPMAVFVPDATEAVSAFGSPVPEPKPIATPAAKSAVATPAGRRGSDFTTDILTSPQRGFVFTIGAVSFHPQECPPACPVSGLSSRAPPPIRPASGSHSCLKYSLCVHALYNFACLTLITTLPVPLDYLIFGFTDFWISISA